MVEVLGWEVCVVLVIVFDVLVVVLVEVVCWLCLSELVFFCGY